MGEPAKPFVCFECGARFALRAGVGADGSLEGHWRTAGHGPRQVQEDAIDRARFSLLGDDAPPPTDIHGTGHRPDHRR